MTKSSFINKKALLTIFIVIFVIAGGVGLYFLLRPKVDLTAPYNDFYSYSINKDVKTVTAQKNQIDGYLSSCISRESEQEQKNKFQDIKNRYENISSIENVYENIEPELLNNLPFTKDNDGKMLKIQQNMSKCYKNLTKYASDCISFYDTYLTSQTIQDKNNYHIIQIIESYNTTYYKYLNELSNFYNYACQIFARYLTPSYQANRLSSYLYTTIGGWQDGIVTNICGENYNYTQNAKSLQNLSIFITNYIDTTSYYKLQTSYDELLDNFDGIDVNLCTEKLATNSYVSFISEQQTDELKEKLNTLGKQFFLVLA